MQRDLVGLVVHTLRFLFKMGEVQHRPFERVAFVSDIAYHGLLDRLMPADRVLYVPIDDLAF